MERNNKNKKIMFMDAHMSDKDIPEHTKELMKIIVETLCRIPYELTLPAMFGIINELVYHVRKRDIGTAVNNIPNMIRDAISSHLLMNDTDGRLQ